MKIMKKLFAIMSINAIISVLKKTLLEGGRIVESNVQALKHYIYELEYALTIEEYDRVRNVARMIKDNIRGIENELDAVTDSATGIYYNHINTLEFLYKPVDVADPYQGDYLERYSVERAYDLMKAGAKEGHDAFWAEHNILKTNVFGIVPVGMIGEEATQSLQRLGWVKVNVDVLDFGQIDHDLKNIYRYCEDSFDNYVTLKEEQTSSTIVLKFAS